MNDDKTIYIITNLKKSRGWNIYIKDNILILDHKEFKEKQPPIIYLYDKVINDSILYVNEERFALRFRTKSIWKHLDNRGNMKFIDKIKLDCFK